MRVAAGRGYVRTKGLPANRVRDRDRNLGGEGGAGREAVDKTACGALRGYAIVRILHVRTGWPGEEGQVRKVPTALRSAANGMLGSSEEW